MDSLIAVLAAGSLIPTIAIIIKKLVIDQVFKNINKEIKIESSSGKSRNYLVNADIDEREIMRIIESEIDFEMVVRKSLNKYINKNRKQKLTVLDDYNADFIVEMDGKKVAVEAKSNLDNFKAIWAKHYIDGNENINELILVVNSKISEQIRLDIEDAIGDSRVKFISSPNGRRLNESLENLLNTEFKIKKV
ncbi:hypothetical protein [Photobacterium chitinilyticum]|uniref:Uncharacterized protein n=1 Tax=Photobacterium chitinilyticum TaxID=2485123 RepID=A0A444JHX4_9GAMM|nr:hypothetical protein [Photobacterium chitinilyticum]RWX52744.1 hypothetical protein EDI28_25690 [Photobacterium chitinilyticum]